MSKKKTHRPFDHLIVLEFSSVLAGPAVGLFFAELGARVIKIESSNGDVTRSWKTANEPKTEQVSAYFSSVNWGKESIAIDLQSEQGKEIAHRLVAVADIVITNFKAGSAKKLELEYKTLRKINPGILYGNITGYGEKSSRPGYDAAIQAESGFMYINREAGATPAKMPVALMDILAAHQLKEGLLTALYQRQRTGEGAYISVSLIEAGVSALANQAATRLVTGQNPQPLGSDHPSIAPYGSVFQTSDGSYILLAVGNNTQFKAMCKILGKPELALDERYMTNVDRVKNKEQLLAILREIISTHKRDDLMEAMRIKSIPSGAILDVSEALAQPEVAALLHDIRTGMHGLRTVSWRSNHNWQMPKLNSPPAIGEHSRSILEGLLGMKPAKVDNLAVAKFLRISTKQDPHSK